MKSTVLSLALIALTCSLSGLAAHAQNLVTNGNFASPALTGENYQGVGPGSTAITGFTVDSTPDGGVQLIGPGFSGQSGPGFSTFTGGAGAQVVQLANGSAGGISQSIATIAGDTYTLSLDISSRYQAGALGVVDFGSSTMPLDPTGNPFTTVSITTIATSTSTLINIMQSATGTENLVIGNLVAVQDTLSVPEPASALPLLAACAAMGLFFWRRRSLLAS